MKTNNLLKLLIGLIVSACTFNVNAAASTTFQYKYQVVNNTDLPLNYVMVYQGNVDIDRFFNHGKKWEPELTHLNISSKGKYALPMNNCNILGRWQKSDYCKNGGVQGSEYFAKTENRLGSAVQPTFNPENGIAEATGGKADTWAVHFTYNGIWFATNTDSITIDDQILCKIPSAAENKMVSIFIEPRNQNKVEIDGGANYYAHTLQVRVSPPGGKDCIFRDIIILGE